MDLREEEGEVGDARGLELWYCCGGVEEGVGQQGGVVQRKKEGESGGQHVPLTAESGGVYTS